MAKQDKGPIPHKRVLTWILVADGARARILAHEGPGKGLVDAMDHDFVGSKERMSDMVSDRPGRTQGSHNSSHHAFGPKTEWHRFEKHLFAKRMAEILEKAATQIFSTVWSWWPHPKPWAIFAPRSASTLKRKSPASSTKT